MSVYQKDEALTHPERMKPLKQILNKVRELKPQRQRNPDPGDIPPDPTAGGGPSTCLLTGFRIFRGPPGILTPSNIGLESRTTCYFTSKLSLFDNGRGIVILDP